MSRNLVIGAAAVLILIAGGWFLMRPKQPAVPAVQPTQAPTFTGSAAPSATGAAMAKEEDLVTVSDAGFSPKNITIPAGGTVSWMNSDTVDHTVNSSPHPTHTDYQPLNLNAIKPGERKSLMFPKAGTYKYHDHLNPSLFGSVTVQ